MSWVPRSSPGASKAAAVAPPRPMPPLIWRWLVSRGFTSPEEIDEFFSPSLSSMTHPFKLKDMDKAVERLLQAYVKQEKICIYGDYDLDGSSGIALLVDGLKGMGFKNVSFYQPSRFLEGYGIHKEALDVIAKRGDQVVISVDCGITAVEEARHARALGLDLIVTDHHLPKEEIPDCVAVVNPNQKGCTSELGYISGVGVGFYLLLGLKSVLKESKFDLKSCLDFFTIGTITDMVPLKRENRVLVKHGLKVLSQTKRPGLQALLKRLNLWGRDLDSIDVAFTLAPKLNALSRLEMGIRPLDVFMCVDSREAEVLSEKVLGLNENRKALQAELEAAITGQLESELEKPVIVLAAKGHAGVVGLVATRINQLTGKPAFIVALHNGEGVGSARTNRDGDSLPTALGAASGSLERFGGHAQAAGFSLKPENFEAFKAAIVGYYEKKEGETAPGKAVEPGNGKDRVFDVEADLNEINENFMGWLKHAGPFGSENPTPLFKISISRVEAVRWLKGQHLKLTVADSKTKVEALAFFAQTQGGYKVEVGEKIELLAEPSWNYFRGEKRLQLLIRDLRKPHSLC